MAKQDAYLLVGPAHSGLPTITAALQLHRDALAERGVRVATRSEDEAFRAAVELRREHRAWALRRKDVEGAWAGICRRALKQARKHGHTVVIGHELFAGAGTDEIDLLVDGLAGLRLHVVLLAAYPDPLVGLVPNELDLADVLARWARAVRAPERVHVLVGDAEPAAVWPELGRLVGFDTDALPLPPPGGPPAGRLDVGTLGLLAQSTAALLDDTELAGLVEVWAKAAAAAGCDVRGDLTALAPAPADAVDVPVSALRAALVETVAEVGRLRGRLADLEVSAAARRPRLRYAR